MDIAELEREFITNLFTILSSRRQIDDAVIARESIKIDKNPSSLSDAESVFAFNKVGAIDEINSKENNIEYNMRMGIVGRQMGVVEYDLPAEISTREKIILNAAMTTAQHQLVEKYQGTLRDINLQMDELNQDGEVLSDPKRRPLYLELDRQQIFLTQSLKTIAADVMKKMRDVRLKTATSDKPTITFYFNALLEVLNNDFKTSLIPTNNRDLLDCAPKLYTVNDLDTLFLNPELTKHDDLLLSQMRLYRAYLYQAYARQFKELSSREQDLAKPALDGYLHEQFKLLKHRWPKIYNELVIATDTQRDKYLDLQREMIVVLQELVTTYEQQVGPLLPELKSEVVMLYKLQIHDDLKNFIRKQGLHQKYNTDDIDKLLDTFTQRINIQSPLKHGDELIDKYNDLMDIKKQLDDLSMLLLSPRVDKEYKQEQKEIVQRINILRDSVEQKKNELEGQPQFKAMRFLINAERYLKSPEREWNVGYQVSSHTLAETGKAIPTNVNLQLKQIEMAKNTGDYEKAKTEFMKIGLNKTSSFFSSGGSNKYFQAFKYDKTVPQERKQEELEGRLDNLFSKK